MGRGGGILHSNLRIHPSIPCWVFFSLSRSPLHLGADKRRFRRTTPNGFGKLLLAENFRSYTCLKEKGYLIVHKAIKESHTSVRVFSSCGPQEAKVNRGKITKDKLLIDCGTDQECVLGGIVALGKFDALHIGHRELAIQASKAGNPFLLSFVGMAEVLGWESRAPIVAKCDRKRVLSSWAPCCGNVVPLEFQVEFSSVRHLTPRQFVERLSKELRVSGLVAGENYRFGYKASGDALELVRLCKEYYLAAYIVSSVMDKTQRSYNEAIKSNNKKESGQVSITRVRQALAMRDMEYVGELLGRKHRLVLMANEGCLCTQNRFTAPKSSMLNQPPEDGVFEDCSLLVDDVFVGQCRVVIDTKNINIELDCGSTSVQNPFQDCGLVGIEFG